MYTLVKPFLPYLVALLAVLGVLFLTYNAGAQSVQKKWDIEKAKAEATAESNQKIVTVETIKYIDRVKVIKEKGDTIVQQVPVYVNAKADAACIIPIGFKRVHDSSAQGVLPGDPERTDETSTTIKLTDVASTVVKNYAICHETAERLTALQNILKTVQ